jgi:hypothetical protein
MSRCTSCLDAYAVYCGDCVQLAACIESHHRALTPKVRQALDMLSLAAQLHNDLSPVILAEPLAIIDAWLKKDCTDEAHATTPNHP